MYIKLSIIRITQILWEEERMELLFTEAKSYIEIASPTKLEVIANTMHSRVGCEKTDLEKVYHEVHSCWECAQFWSNNFCPKLSLIMSQQKCEESEHDRDCLMEMKDKLTKETAVSESCISDKWSIQCVPEIEKCMFCPMNSCLKWVVVKLTRYEHNYSTFLQFIWSWVTENMWNTRVNKNIFISRENAFPLWYTFFCQSVGLITIYLSTHLNDLLTLTIQTRKDRRKWSKKRDQTGRWIQSLKALIQAREDSFTFKNYQSHPLLLDKAEVAQYWVFL